MKKTITISIGNSDNWLNQSAWANYVKALKETIDPDLMPEGFRMAVLHFFGFTNPDSIRQSCTAVLEIDTDELYKVTGKSFEEFMEYTLRPGLARIAAMYDQESIAVTIGETEFVYGHKEGWLR